jgi:hypothetical protein
MYACIFLPTSIILKQTIFMDSMCQCQGFTLHYIAAQYYKIYNIVHIKVTCACVCVCMYVCICMHAIMHGLFQSSPLYYVFKLFCLQNQFEICYFNCL